jgi:flagellar hook assembly protein FlgD
MGKTFLRVLTVSLVLAALIPQASGAGVRFAARDEPVGAASSPRIVRKAPLRFDLVGLHWKGSGTVFFRTRSLVRTWSAWQPARPEAEDAPDRGTREAERRLDWKLGSAYWTGPADAIEYRFSGQVKRLRAFFLWSEPDAVPLRTVNRAARPSIITRAQWGADESIVRAAPSYADRLRFAVVHHTAGTNSYTAAQSAAIVRGIQRYHVLANGWNDIGYNFLVDNYGQIFEGRGGGMAANVVGAHAQGFNTGSTGVSVLGTYSSSRVTTAARSALVRLLAWRLDVAHVDPESRLTWISGGNPEYPAGTAVRLRAVAGHRDTGPTSCPGNALYAQLPGIASDVASRGLPKLYDPAVAGKLGGPVRVTGRLSTALPWTVTIRDGAGTRVAGGSGSGTRVDWTWDASAIPFGTFTYTIAAGPDVRSWTDDVPGPPPLVVRGLRASPSALTPNGDGSGERTTISFSLTTAASVTVDIEDGSGQLVRRLASASAFPRGTARLIWNGRATSGALVADGRYSVQIDASSPGQTASASGAVVVDRTLGHLEVAPRPFSPNGDGRRETTTASFDLTRQASVHVRVMRGSTRIVTLASATLAAGHPSFTWDGRTGAGERAADGKYAIRVDATTSLGTRVLTQRFRLDTTRPVVRILSAVADRRTKLVLSLSEAARVRIWYGVNADPVTRDLPAGRTTLYRSGVFLVVRVVGWDTAENRSAAVRARVTRL